MTVTNREARQWDQVQRQELRRNIAARQQEALAAYLRRQSNTPKGASGCSQAVVSHEGRAVAARGSRPHVNAGMNSARATVSTTAAAPAENPGTSSATPLTGAGAGARLQQAKQIIGQRALL